MKTLTNTLLNGLKPETERYEVSDAATNNLCVVVYPTGRLSWLWRGRINGRLKKFTLGRYPTHSLAEARVWAAEVSRGRDHGVNVVEVAAAVEEAKKEVDARTCDWLFALYMEHEGNSRASAPEKWRLYNRDIKPAIGDRSVMSITHADLAAITRAKVKTAPTASNALQRLIRRWFRWSITHGRDLSGLVDDPARDLPKFAPDKTRDRFLNDFEIRVLLEAMQKSRSRFIQPLSLILYTAVRRAEAFELPWSELDLDKGDWMIPRTRTKNGVDHLLPLPHEMVSLLNGIEPVTGMKLVWPGKGRSGLPMSGFSNAIEALQSEMTAIASAKGRLLDPWSIHDLRRTVITGMNALRGLGDQSLIPEHVVERVANHKPPRLQGIYNRHSYYAEKKQALRHWADHLATLRPSR